MIMITRRRSRLLSASACPNTSVTDKNDPSIKTKEIKLIPEALMKSQAEMVSNITGQNITIPIDLFKDFENLKNVTKLDSATLMRKLLTDFHKLKEPESPSFDSPEEHLTQLSTCDYSEKAIKAAIEANRKHIKKEDMSSCHEYIPSTTIAEINTNSNNESDNPTVNGTNSPGLYSRNKDLQLNQLNHQRKSTTPRFNEKNIFCKEEDTSVNDNFGVDVVHGSKLFQSKLELENNSSLCNDSAFYHNAINSKDTRNCEPPHATNSYYYSGCQPVSTDKNHLRIVHSATTSVDQSKNIYTANKKMNYQDDRSCRESDSESPLDLSVVKLEPHSSHTSLTSSPVPSPENEQLHYQNNSKSCRDDVQAVTVENWKNNHSEYFGMHSHRNNSQSPVLAASKEDVNHAVIKNDCTSPEMMNILSDKQLSSDITPQIFNVPQMQVQVPKSNEAQLILSPPLNSPCINESSSQNTGNYFSIPSQGTRPVPVPTNVVTLQKNDNCMYVYPMGFPALTTIPQGSHPIGLPIMSQAMVPLSKIDQSQPVASNRPLEQDQLKLVAESNIFPGVYTSILKLSSHKRARSKPEKLVTTPVSQIIPTSTNVPIQPINTQTVMFFPTQQMQTQCMSTNSVNNVQSIPSSTATAVTTIAQGNISSPRECVTMSSVGQTSTQTTGSNHQSIIMVYPHTGISALGKPVRRRGRPPKLPMLTQLLIDKKPKVNVNQTKEEKPNIKTENQNQHSAVAPPFPVINNNLKPETKRSEEKMDCVEFIPDSPTNTRGNNDCDQIKHFELPSQPKKPESLYQEMILSPKSLKNIKPRKSHSANDFMKPNANFICTSFRIRPRAFRTRRNSGARGRKSTRLSQPGQPQSIPSPLQQQINQQQMELQQQLQQQVQKQQQQQLQQQQQKKMQEQQQLLQQQLQQQIQQQLQQQQLQHNQLQNAQQLQSLSRHQTLMKLSPPQLQEQDEEEEEEEHDVEEDVDRGRVPNEKESIIHSPKSLHSNDVNSNSSDGRQTEDDVLEFSSEKNLFQELYHCKICNDIVSSDEKVSHQRQHVPVRFFCQTCGMEYQCFWVRSQVTDDDNPPEPMECDRCNSHFSSQKYDFSCCLQIQNGNILCDLCVEQFRTFTQFYDHRNKYHPNSPTTAANHYVCDNCDKVLYSAKALRYHRKLHLDRTVQCTIGDCPRFFPNNMELSRHIREQHDKMKEFFCIYDGCNKKFMKNFHLQEHVRVKHFNIRAFRCSWPGCTKEFAAERHLKVHLLIHKDEKPLKCDFCEYRCRQRNALNWHMRKHPEAPYKYRKFSITSSDC